jgi:hypothetical protein
VQNLSSFSLLPKNIKIQIQSYIFLPFIFCGWETWSRTLVEERKLLVFENRVLRRIFGPKRDTVTGSGENYILRSLMICVPHQILFI